ncbi:ATP-binding protein [Rubrivirga marina]|uniref:ATPase n=1 Tax=Rubrivirga marina TaxID=1196024 RepID=A0A271IZ93_9BACT|nr:ATP-binding protein [Rubrivirga marina]PAP76025.1 ATPase [Rubrivirga marina]
MSAAAPTSWHEANQRHLGAALDEVRAALDRAAGLDADSADEPTEAVDFAAFGAPAALEQVVRAFGLSPFERAVLLLCAGMELTAAFAEACARAGSDRPTFGLALASLPEAHWSALAPTAPLRRWRLLEVGSGERLVDSPLRLDERLLHHLNGVQHLDENLLGFVYPEAGGELVPSHEAVAEAVADVWARNREPALPAIQLNGVEPSGKRDVAAAACARLGLGLFRMPASVIPGGAAEFDALVQLWTRESALSGAALLLDADEVAPSDTAMTLVRRLVDEAGGPLILASRERTRTARRPTVAFDVGRPTRPEQRALWTAALGEHAATLNGHVGRVTDQFDLSGPSIRAASLRALDARRPAADALWDACRVQARQELDGLARSVEPRATWDDLVLPEPQLRTLRAIEAHVRHRLRVHEDWGFGARSDRGLGITALFSGHSGTGKTLAAEVLANVLGLDLYHIDLSAVVSKYIGETETNLRRVFDAAEAGGAVLLFDEADALFGKRSEVKDSHDRYANLEVSYLLQRMEAYRGLAVLTTNLKNAIDDAFERRLRFRVAFPFPDAPQRAAIWRRVFPAQTPTDGLDPDTLAGLNATGGTIRNVALHAAFLAAEADGPVRMAHVRQAARDVYAQLEKPLTDRELAGWS